MASAKQLLIAFCFTGLAVCAARPASAARLLQVYIEQDGEVVAHTYYEDGGRADAATVWRYLAKPPIMVDEDNTKLEPSGDDQPLAITLNGKLVIKIQHTNNVMTQGEFTSLSLRRDDFQTQAWYLPEAEVERTAGVIGLGPPTSFDRKLLNGYLATIGTCILILLICIATTFVLLKGPTASQTNEPRSGDSR